ncbi:MAG: C10 family peptidase [Sedimentisphaerales bacterium]|nr:C10 family peptidase [Sedimentisphaerales bacterium]
MTSEQAKRAAKGWLEISSNPFFVEANYYISEAEIFTDDFGEPLYFIVNLQPSGFVIVSADDAVEPIIGFSGIGSYDVLSDNPLTALVTQDIPCRIADAKQKENYQLLDVDSQVSKNQKKWNYLITLSHAAEGGFEIMGLSDSSMADIRAAPLIKSKWSQTTCCLNNPLPCYNYYTPEGYPCGCIATAMAQLMRYHKYPVESINQNSFEIVIDGTLWTSYLIRGSGKDGAYNWDTMPLDPNCSTTQVQRKIIGALCYDAGISISTNYYPEISVADAYNAKNALKSVFKYGNAIAGYNESKEIGSGLINMINPNLDAGDPVILAITRKNGGHTVLCDGYGYSSDTMYHHLNMGWAGISDAWYNLPDVNAIDRTYTSVVMCIYNIHVSSDGDGEVISGRIFDHNGKPVADANVHAESLDKQTFISTSTNDKGIYAFDCLNSATTYTIQPVVPGMIFSDKIVTTGTSLNDKPVSGNIWGVDFTADYAGDFDADGDIDGADFSIFASTWLSTPEKKHWNPSCDLNTPPDNIINSIDLHIFMQNWIAISK